MEKTRPTAPDDEDGDDDTELPASRGQPVYPDPEKHAMRPPYPSLPYGVYGPFPGSQATAKRNAPATYNHTGTLAGPSDVSHASLSRPRLSPDSVVNQYLANTQANWRSEPHPLTDANGESRLHSSAESIDEREGLEDLADDASVATGRDSSATPGRRGRGRGRRKRGGGWRQLLKGTEWENLGKIPMERERGGTRRRGGGGGRGRAKKAVDPGADFKTFQASALAAYVEGDLETAADLARQAIQANPEIFHAHSLLSEILKRQGKVEDSVTAMYTGAHVGRHPDTWTAVAERMLDMAGPQRDETYLRKAIDCYGEALKLRSSLDADTDFELRVRKFELYKELGDSKFARLDCKNVLRIWPKNTHFLREYAHLCAAWQDQSELTRAKEAYEKAFDLYAEEGTFGDGEDAWSHLNIYLEVVDMVGDPAEGIARLKRLARWFLGRQSETFWDRYTDDDREFDLDNHRRGLVSEFQSGQASFDPSKYGDGLPIELRVRLGLFRLKIGIGEINEALNHFRPLLQYVDQIEDYSDLFLQVATKLQDAGYLGEAVEYYDSLRREEVDIPNETTWLIMAACYQSLDRKDDAMVCLENVLSFGRENYARAGSRLAKMYEDEGDIDKAQALYNEILRLGRPDLLGQDEGTMMTEDPYRPSGAAPAVSERNEASGVSRDGAGNNDNGDVDRQSVIDGLQVSPLKSPGRKRRATRAILPSHPRDSSNANEEALEETSPKRPRLGDLYNRKKPKGGERARQIQNTEARVQANYSFIKVHGSIVTAPTDDETVEQWIECAKSMLDDFRSMKIFFPSRDKMVKLRAVDDGVYVRMPPKATASDRANTPKDFCNILFSEWHRIFVDVALLHARRGEKEKCYHVVQDVLFGANVFFLDPALEWAQYGAAISCGLRFNDGQYLIDLARKLITKGDFRAGGTFSLFAALAQLCESSSSNWFSAGPTQKFMLRMVKLLDFVAMPAAVRDRLEWSIHKRGLEHRAERIDPVAAAAGHTQLDPGVLLTYGHMIAVANHAHSALPYYLRVLALCPAHPLANLCCATMWIQNSMKRQTDNRQFGLAQGLAYLFRYHRLRCGTEPAGPSPSSSSSSSPVAERQEAEFNVARAWHELGLIHLAIPGYERVLGLSAAVQAEFAAQRGKGAGEEREEAEDEPEDFAMEAAFALEGIYAVMGNVPAAREVAEAWLVL